MNIPYGGTPSYMYIVLLSSCPDFAPQLPLNLTMITAAYRITASFITAAYFLTSRKPITSLPQAYRKPISGVLRGLSR